jgi:SNF2 family DNA or RNA helicase
MTPKRKLWLLTGTPCPNDPRDVWALARLIDRSRVPEHFGTWERMTMMQVSQYKWVPKRDSFAKAYEAMQPAIRFEKRDCNINLPQVMPPRDIQAENTPEQIKMLSDMRLLFRAQFVASGGMLTAVNAADKINKLRQILLGCVKTGEDEDYQIIPHAPRVKALLDLIQAASNKVLVVVPFKGILRSLAEDIGKHVSVGVLNGDVPTRRREKIIAAFKNETHPQTLLCHPKVMAHGLNLTEADTLIFYGPIYSNDQYEQVCERFNRLGQKHTMWIYRIGSDQLDWDIYDVVHTKRLNQQSLLTMYRTHVDALAARHL